MLGSSRAFDFREVKGTPPRSAILITVVWPPRAVFAFIVFISLFRQDSCPSSLLLCLIVFLWCQCFVFVGYLLPNVWEKWDCDLSRRRCQWCKHRDKENLAVEERSECGGDIFFCETLSTGFLSIGSRPVTLQLGTTFPQWAGAPQLQGMNREPRGWRSKPHKATVAMFYCSPFPFKPRLLWVLPPELAAEANGRRSSQPITPESISVDVDHWRGRQQLAMKAWTQFQLARCDRQCGNFADDSASEVSQWTPSRPVVVVVVGRRRRRSPPEAASRVAMVGDSFSVLVM